MTGKLNKTSSTPNGQQRKHSSARVRTKQEPCRGRNWLKGYCQYYPVRPVFRPPFIALNCIGGPSLALIKWFGHSAAGPGSSLQCKLDNRPFVICTDSHITRACHASISFDINLPTVSPSSAPRGKDDRAIDNDACFTDAHFIQWYERIRRYLLMKIQWINDKS